MQVKLLENNNEEEQEGMIFQPFSGEEKKERFSCNYWNIQAKQIEQAVSIEISKID